MTDLLTFRMMKPYLWSDFLFKFSDCYRRQQDCLKILNDFTGNVMFNTKMPIYY